MRGEATLRAVSGAAAMLGGRGRSPGRLCAVGLLLGVATFGISPVELPTPQFAGFLALVLVALLALLYERTWSPIVGEAASDTFCMAVPAALAASFALRGADPLMVAAGGATVLAALSFFGAHGSVANAEAGWRRAALWAIALALPVAVAAAMAWALDAFASARAGLTAGAVAAAVAAWIGPAFLEWGRTERELVEEVRLGFLPEEDAVILQRPWRRRAEPRFGRADERREYVRAALLLAVARQQQRRRSGEAIRLRQLEVLSFRTRMRRALEVRAERARREAADYDEAGST